MTSESEALQEPDLTLVRSMHDIAVKTGACDRLFGIGSADSWDVDLEQGAIRFTHPDHIATAPVQVVGTYNTLDGTWLWGWDHPSVQEPFAAAARACRAFGERYGLTDFTERKLSCSEDDAWRFTALACYLSGATGAYRGPSATTHVFMTFGDVTLTKPERRSWLSRLWRR